MATKDGTKKKLTVKGELIESAVNSKHEHSNKTVLDKLSDNNGTLQYNGADITGGGSNYTLPTASETVLGGVMVDGTTITVNSDGVISSVGSVITSIDGGTFSTTTVECTGISLNNSTLTFATGSTQTLSATVTPSNCTQTVTWSSNTTGVATVSNGVVTPVGNGTATITATCGSHSATCTVTVQLKTLSSISAVYTQGDSVVYPSTSLNDLKSNLVVTANYSDSTTATITDYTLNGTLSVGTSTVTVTYSGKTTTFNVTVSEESTTTSYVAGYYNDEGVLTQLERNYVDNNYLPANASTPYQVLTPFGVENIRLNEYDADKNFIQRRYEVDGTGNKTWAVFDTTSTTAFVKIGFAVTSDKDNEESLNSLFSTYTFKTRT